MPRQARKLSESGYMHLIVRGIGKQIIFEEEADYGTKGRFSRPTGRMPFRTIRGRKEGIFRSIMVDVIR